MPSSLPARLRTPAASARLLVLLNYTTEEVVEAITKQHDLTESDARDVIAAVQEKHLSADRL